jgi:hypothetical protein
MATLLALRTRTATQRNSSDGEDAAINKGANLLEVLKALSDYHEYVLMIAKYSHPSGSRLVGKTFHFQAYVLLEKTTARNQVTVCVYFRTACLMLLKFRSELNCQECGCFGR